ncbi:leucyl-tRNA synthetase, putative [Babesia ovata]|uniref:Leucyl-tRNA synthetase, putative n=1 Tax=Babesia ovata TaxID=189622 RepID=A0A2H6KCP5_9APIC|nr:leucyl-tRNA synthetase, putative [Babesia ovata]GBE60757.1 leucyl-tRNA synthetase, putative [Babesia ovata]
MASSFLHLGLLTSGIILDVGGPEGKVVPKQLHDEGAVFVAVLADAVELRDGLVEGAFRHFAGLMRLVEDLVEEDGEVQGKSKADRVGGFQLGLCDLRGLLVGFLGRG